MTESEVKKKIIEILNSYSYWVYYDGDPHHAEGSATKSINDLFSLFQDYAKEERKVLLQKIKKNVIDAPDLSQFGSGSGVMMKRSMVKYIEFLEKE